MAYTKCGKPIWKIVQCTQDPYTKQHQLDCNAWPVRSDGQCKHGAIQPLASAELAVSVGVKHRVKWQEFTVGLSFLPEMDLYIVMDMHGAPAGMQTAQMRPLWEAWPLQ